MLSESEGLEKMRIAVSSSGDDIKRMVDMRFGRCSHFIIADIEEKRISNWKAIVNPGAMQGHGAGLKAAELVGNEGVDAVITGNLGPKASAALDNLGIEPYQGEGTIESTISSYIDSKLNKLTKLSEPHTGMNPRTNPDDNEERIFFPLVENNGLDSNISQHFGHAPFFGLYLCNEKKFEVIANDLDHTDPTKSPIDQIVEAVNPTMIFAKGIGGRAIGIIREKGLKLKTGNFRTVKEAIDNLEELSDEINGCGHEH